MHFVLASGFHYLKNDCKNLPRTNRKHPMRALWITLALTLAPGLTKADVVYSVVKAPTFLWGLVGVSKQLMFFFWHRLRNPLVWAK